MLTTQYTKHCSTGKKLASYPIVSTVPVCAGHIDIHHPPTPFGSIDSDMKLANSPFAPNPYKKQ